MGDEMESYIVELKEGISPDLTENVFTSIWNEYERVIVKSLITSFGLDFLVHDQHGGDVDTIHNVREIGKDEKMIYKNSQNQINYDNREMYDNAAYHSDKRYRQIVKNAKDRFNENGTMIEDAYVQGQHLIPKRAKTIPREQQAQLDHVIATEKIHNDPGRLLAGLDGKTLANCKENLRFTNASLNRDMSNKSIDEYIQYCKDNPDKINWNGNKGEPLPKEVESQLKREYNRAKKDYNAKLEKAYYTSQGFLNDTAKAAGNRGIEMGLRQSIGLIFVEIWMASKEELQAVHPGSDLKTMLESIGRGIKKGTENARLKYKELMVKFGEGFFSGAIASLTTTLCNIFFTTARNLVKCIRQIYASVIEAGNVLLFNPNNLMFGDRIKTATVIIATGASVLVGTVVGELIGETPIAQIPGIGGVVGTFCSTLVSGLLSCTLLVFLDRSRFMNLVIDILNRVPSEANNYKEIADTFEIIAAKLEQLDITKFREDTQRYKIIAMKIECAETEEEVNELLLSVYKTSDIKIPWKGDFDSFMSKKENHLVFE